MGSKRLRDSDDAADATNDAADATNADDEVKVPRAATAAAPYDGDGRLQLVVAERHPFLLPNNAMLLAKVPKCTQAALAFAWSQFEKWDDTTRKVFLDGVMARCEWPQLPYTSNLIKGLLRVDFLEVLPTEIAYQILSHLDATSLCRASMVSKTWKRLAEDNQIWLRMCEQHIGHRCKNCGWGLPRATLDINQLACHKSHKRLYAEKHIIARNWKFGRYAQHTLLGHTDGITCVQMDESRIVSGSYDHTIRIWDLNTRTCTNVLVGHERSVQALQFNTCMIVSGSMDKTVRIWCIRTGRCMRRLEHSEGVLSVAFDGKRIVCGTLDGLVHVWDLKGNVHYSLSGHQDRVNCVHLFQDRFVFSASDDTTVCLWDVTTRERVRKFVGHTAQVQCLQTRDKLLVTGAFDNTLKVWDIELGRCVKTLFGHVEGVWSLAFDSLRIVSGAHDKTLKIWDMDDVDTGTISTGQAAQSFQDHDGPINCVALSESIIVTGSDDRCIKIWDFGAS